jgi:hypothetical protein
MSQFKLTYGIKPKGIFSYRFDGRQNIVRIIRKKWREGLFCWSKVGYVVY